ncbi:AMP-binding protein [Pseudomonas sp. 2FG]|uniref:AMP-binding protein n=1 Tax=Pseudomonas sp. 2FG TaxID=2502191 RepID=UPI0010F6813D|nr:AMP-binding protein [Pseudomonas sp. 2FG]
MNRPRKDHARLKLVSALQDSHELPDLGVATIVELLQRSAARTPQAPALSALGASISYEELQSLSASVATWLINQGLQPGARVAVALPNMLAHPVACLGIIRAGCTAVCVNPLYTAQELAQVFKDSEVKAVFLFEPMSLSVQHAMRESGVSIAVRVAPGDLLGWRRPLVNWVARRRLGGESVRVEGAVAWRRVVATRAAGLTPRSPITAEQTAFMIYSGGTTGQPKGVPITHRALMFNVAQQYSALRLHLLGKSECDYVLLLAVPLYHILGLGNLLFTLAKGGKAVLVMNPRDTATFVKEWSRHRVSSFPGVNTLYNSLLENEAFRSLDFKGLAICLGAGMPVSEATAKRWHEVTGCHITEAYGMTETGLIACNPVGRSRPGSVGQPVAGIEISLRDDAGDEVTIGDAEICVRSPAVMAGYWRRPEENASAFTSDGFFRTGDIGVFDPDGYLRLVDRKKEMIISSGFKVFPSEIERVLNAHPGVMESAVVPAPDEKAGEIPIAYVVRRQPYLDEAHVIAHCEKHLVSYKRPRRIIFRDDLPKSNVGKILRKELVAAERLERSL